MATDKFQYKTIERPHDKLEDEINALAQDGWRVIGVSSLGNSWNVMAVLEKQK